MKKEMDFQGFLRALEPYSNIGLTAPAGADGDSVGTQCSLHEILSARFPDKRIRIINEEACPQRYRFLTQAKLFEVSSTILKSDKQEWPDCLVCVDGGVQRIGPDTTVLWKNAKSHGQVDHHAVGAVGEYEFRLYDPEAAATTEMVFRMVQSLGMTLTKTMAQAIYVGLIFDTGLFKHSNTKPETLRIGAALLETGFDHTFSAEQAMLIRTDGALHMLRTVLNNMHFEIGGRYVWSLLDNKNFLAAGGDADDREGLIDNLFLTRNCEIAAFYFERSPGEWKISFRARGRDVAAVAQTLSPSGGGHKLAAGCSLNGPQNEVLERCHQAVRKVLGNA
jgi:bifunctional oligoribonuclease and PAP phosphatase NrnA